MLITECKQIRFEQIKFLNFNFDFFKLKVSNIQKSTTIISKLSKTFEDGNRACNSLLDPQIFTEKSNFMHI